MRARAQQEFSIPGILVRVTRISICNLVLVSKYENGHMIILILSRQVRARKMILDLVSKNCTFPWGERHLRKRELVAKKLTLTKRLRFPKIDGQCTFYHGWPPRNCMHISEAFQV